MNAAERKKEIAKRSKPMRQAPGPMRKDRYSRLADYIKQRQGEPFRWGQNDCCLFACNAIEAMTGNDIVPPQFRGGYDSMPGAYRLIREYCGGGLAEIAAKLAADNGMIEIEPPFMQRGDIALVQDAVAGEVLGVCIGAEIAIVHKTAGLEYRSITMAKQAWRVP